MALVAERSHDHQKPRHLAFCFGRGGWSFRVQIEVELVGLEEAMMTTSHFDGFKDKALCLANFPTIWICCWRDDKLLVTDVICMSKGTDIGPMYEGTKVVVL